MINDGICATSLLSSIGFVGVVLGVLARSGLWKGWFSMRRIPTVVIPDISFGAIPLGLGFLILGVSLGTLTNSTVSETVECLALLLMGLGLVLTIWTPDWLKPRWYCWLESNYGDIIGQLRQDAQHIGHWQWQRMVRTQEGLEQWAEEVRQRVNARRWETGDW